MFFQMFIFASVAALGATVLDCPRELHRERHLRTFGQSCYSFHAGRVRQFDSAENYCKMTGGHLVKIRDAATQNFLNNAMPNDAKFNFYGAVWIGLTDYLTEGHYIWMDGSPATYTNWAYGEPDSYVDSPDRHQNCVYMDLRDGGRWHDARCTESTYLEDYIRKLPFICEYPAVNHTAVGIVG